MKNILVFGGAGYLGQELIKAFSNTNNEYQVIVFDNFSNGDSQAYQKIKATTTKIIIEDISDAKKVSKAINDIKPCIIYNLAAIHYIPYCIEHPQEVFSTNIIGLQNIISSINSLSPSTRLIFTSSASVYGTREKKCRESDPYNPNDIYGATKVSGELMIKHQVKDYVIMRLFNLTGGNDPHPHLTPKIVENALKDRPLQLGAKTARRDFIDVEDVAQALYAARNAPQRTVLNVGTGSTHSVEEMVNETYQLLGKKPKVSYETPLHIRKNDAPSLCADTTAIQEVLEWAPRKRFIESIKSAIEAKKVLH